MSQGNAVLLITGPSGSGKTSLLPTAADYLWEELKQILRMVTADGGGWGSRVQAYVNQGLIQVWRVRSRWAAGYAGLVEETLAKAAQGWWPAAMADPANGECVPGCALIPPAQTVRILKCSKGHELQRTTGALSPQQCVSCSVMVTLPSGIIEVITVPTPGFEKIGGYAFEGITSWSDIQLQSLSDRRANNELHGEKSSIGSFASGEFKFDGNNRADYGFAQTQAPRWLNFSSTIPGLKIPPIWTGLETVIDDGGTSLPYWAPAIAGQAKSGMVPQWVGNYLGTSWVEGGTAESGQPIRTWRLHTSPYKGDDGKNHIYKTRAGDAGLIPPILQDVEGANGKIVPFSGFSLEVFFRLLNQATANTEKEVLEKFKDAPGLPAAMQPMPVDPASAVLQATTMEVPQPVVMTGQPAVQPPTPSTVPKKSKVVIAR